LLHTTAALAILTPPVKYGLSCHGNNDRVPMKAIEKPVQANRAAKTARVLHLHFTALTGW
jgi:hypothetical protein